MEGKPVVALGDVAEPNANGTEGGDDEPKEHHDINDASIRIASLQAQLDKERMANQMIRENAEADLKDMERKLKEALEHQSKTGKQENSEYEEEAEGEKVDEKIMFML